jgi:hypothetical protein
MRYNNNNSTTSNYSITLDQAPFNTKPKLLRTNSKPKIYQPSQQQQQSQQQQIQMSPVNTTVKTTDVTSKQPASISRQAYNQNNVEIVGKKLISPPANTVPTTTTSFYTPTIFSQPQHIVTNSNTLSSVSSPMFIENNSIKKRANALRSK